MSVEDLADYLKKQNIGISGIENAGKTTLSLWISKKYKIFYHHKHLKIDNFAWFNENIDNLFEKFKEAYVVEDAFKKNAKKGIIFDRGWHGYILKYLALLKDRNITVNEETIEKVIDSFPDPYEDIIIILDLGTNNKALSFSLEREENGYSSSFKMHIMHQIEIVSRYANIFKKFLDEYDIKLYYVDATKKLEEVKRKVEEILSKQIT